jgi:glycosyltransferase involved in cell wall biosynthesis
MRDDATDRALIWWGRGDAAYSRNAIVREAMTQLGWTIEDYRPGKAVSLGILKPDGLTERASVVWVPCFRQRDLTSASRFAQQRGIPLVADPLISAYDKQVFEKQKFLEDSRAARRLLRWERSALSKASRVVADTTAHADFFEETLGVVRDRLSVIPVGADARVFRSTPVTYDGSRRMRVLFYGSFIQLQAPQVIVEAARRCRDVDWCLLGDGPLRATCEAQASDLEHVTFEPWIDYLQLPQRIAEADLLLGVFSDSAKAGRVVPNKVYQALACGRLVVTRQPLMGAYPWAEGLSPDETGIIFVPPADPEALAEAVQRLSRSPSRSAELGCRAARSYERYCSMDVVTAAVERVLTSLPR